MMIKPLAAMLSAGLLMIGCRTSPLVTDYGMTSSLSKTSQSTVYPNSSVPLKMEVKSTTDGKIKVEYVSCNLSGSLLVGGEEIQPGRFFEHDFSSPLYMSFVPEEAGEAELRFTVSNGVVTTDVAPLRFVVDEASFGLQMISDTVVTVGIKENLAFAIRELQTKASSSSKASGNKFKISGRINKGRGVLQVKDKVLDDNSISSKSVLGQSSLAQLTAKTKGESTSVEVAKDEETQMYYTSMSIGENALIFDISDEFDNTVSTTVNLKAGSPAAELIATLKEDSTYQAAVRHRFTVFPDTKGSDIQLSMAWAVDPTKGSITDATITCRETEIPAGEKVDLVCNYATPMTVSTESIGTLGLRFQVRDPYGSNYDTTYVITVVSPSIDFAFPDIASRLSEWKPYEWTGNLQAETGSNTYQISYKNDDPESGLLTINGAAPIDGDRTDLRTGKNIFRYLPKTTGIHNLTFVVYDRFENEKSYPVTFKVDANKLGVTVAPVSKVNYGQSVNVSVNVPAQEHIKSFTGVVSSIDGGTADIEANGSRVSENKEFALKTGTNVFKITPTTVSDEYKFNLLVKSDIGQEEVHEVVVPIVLPELKASTSADGQTIQYKTTTPFTLTISEALHTDPFAVVPTLVNGDGVLRLESGRGQELVFGAKVDMAAGTHNLTFTPADLCAKENVDIRFEITDSHQTVTTAHARFHVKANPLSFILDNVSASTTHVTVPVTFTLTIDEQEAPESPYTLTYTADNKGTVKIGNAVLDAGGSKTLTKGTHNLSYTPSAAGTHRVVFTVQDMFYQQESATLTIEAKNAPIEASASIGSAATTVKTAASFTVSANEADYTDVFKTTVTNTGEGTLTANGTPVSFGKEFNMSGGNTTMAYTPHTLGDHMLYFTVKDIYGQSKEFSVKISADYAPMTVKASGPSSMYVSRNATIALSLAEDNYTDNFTVSYSGGTGVLKNGTAVWNPGTDYSLANGSANLTYTPSSVGSHTLKFTVKDSYGQTKESSVAINVTQAPLTVSATPAAATVYTQRTATSTLAVSEAEHSDQFTVETTITGGGGSLTINGTEVGNGGSIDVNGGNSSIGFTPSAAGTHTITLNVSDAYGQSKNTVFTVTANDPEIEASVTSPSTYRTKPVEVVLNLDKPDYTGTFSTTVQQSGNGTLTLSGKNVAGTQTLGKGATRFTYTPSSIGTHTLTFKMQAADGKTKTVTSTVNVTESPITLTATPSNSYVQAQESAQAQFADVHIQVVRNYYTGGLQLSLEKITCDESYPQNNTTSIQLRTINVNETLKDEYITEFSGANNDFSKNEGDYKTWNETTTVSGNGNEGKGISVKIRCFGIYHPAGNDTDKKFTLHFKATDDNGQSEATTAVVHVSLP